MFHTCGPRVNVGEVLVALQFDFIKDVHLLLCRERTIKPHLLSTTNKSRSLTLCLHLVMSTFEASYHTTADCICCWSGQHMWLPRGGNHKKTTTEAEKNISHIFYLNVLFIYQIMFDLALDIMLVYFSITKDNVLLYDHYLFC